MDASCFSGTAHCGIRTVSSEPAAEEPVPSRRQKLAAALLSVGGFLAFYVLSAGPMAGLHRVFRFRGFQRAVEFVYTPLVVLVKSGLEPFTSILRWYIELFR